MMVSVFIYGTGYEYDRLMTVLPMHKKIEVLGIICNEKFLYSRIDGNRCFLIDEIDLNRADYIIAAVENYIEVIDILHSKGVAEERIIPSHVFCLPGFKFDKYLELKESNISILSNYCLGGLVYKQLGLRALSPTINMFCAGKDYLEFLENYEYYLDCEMEEYINWNYVDGTIGRERFMEKGILGNRVVWNFNHYIDAKIAIDKWNQRKVRFNKNNVAAIMIIQCDEDAYRFSELNIEKKIGIYYKDLNLKDIIFLPEWCDGKAVKYNYGGSWPVFVMTRMVDTRGHRCPINWIKFLLGEEKYERVERKEISH